ncbi:2,3-bisphosphoglycerate-independent phosphoglycerate mutase [Candidatus Fermentibacterales bacterium]|nr:2,3-bisphosphoglycerate-independent phosphoglycerate mutase [Candidatus Fermentibacterales bacterium]
MDREPADLLAERSPSRILLSVLDGLGDVSLPELEDRTPLEEARTPVLDSLAARSELGAMVPVSPGVTPGSGPAHLALFGYDPLRYRIGRGVLSALGIGFDLRDGDLAARINFCTVDSSGVVTDRRAGRIDDGVNRELVEALSGIGIEGVELFVRTVKQHRACVIFRGEGLSDELADTDPGLVGRRPVQVEPLSPAARRSAEIVGRFVQRAKEVLSDRSPANMLLLRGFARHVSLPSMRERFALDPAAVAIYPMYKGVASLVGMKVLGVEPETLEAQVRACALALEQGHDFVFLHHKPADSAGEDGDCARKIAAIEEFDEALPSLLDLGFDVVAVTGDHSTPCPMKLHSWHPVPLLVHSENQRRGYASGFSEREALLHGALGVFPSKDLLPILLAYAGKLGRFGA